MKKKILVIGDLILDEYINGNITKISQEAPIPIININPKLNSKFILGGASNVAANIKSLGHNVKLVGMIGECHSSHQIKTLLKKKKISHHLIKHKNYNLTKKTRILVKQSQVVRMDKDAINLNYDQKELNNAIINELDKTKILIISDYNKGTVNNLKEIISLANKKKIKVLIDSKKKKLNQFKNCFLLKPNEKEFQEIFGLNINQENLNAEIFRMLKKNNIQNLLLTLGKNGMKLYSKNSIKYFKPNIKDIYDVTGAGDTVMASLAVGISNNYELNDAVNFSLRAAERVIAKVGTSEITIEEIEEVMHNQMIEKRKIFSLTELNKKLKKHKEDNKIIVFTNGCFDLLHPGHLQILKKSKQEGNFLVVGLNSDKSVKKIKGLNRPLIKQTDRANLLAAITYVDYVVIFDEKTPYKIINKIKPNILTKGSDYINQKIVGANVIKKNGGRVVIISKYKNYSTSRLLS